jgi:hypothetical protein
MQVQRDRGVAASRAALLWFVKEPVGRLVLAIVLSALAGVVIEAVRAAGRDPVEAFGAIFGVLGTLLLATRTRWAGFGWLAFLASNACWLWFAIAHRFDFMFWQQTAFTASSLVGAWVWLVKEQQQQGESQ